MIASLAAFGLCAVAIDPATNIWFTTEAKSFTESCPLGNGRIGAMVFGGVQSEKVVLNESTMWSGSPQDADRPDAYKVLPEIRRLLLEGHNRQAQDLLQKNFICQGPGSGSGGSKDGPYGCYQVFADLDIKLPRGGQSDYRRVLDLDRAIASVEYVQDGVHFRREAFCSAPANVFAYRFTAGRPGKITFDAHLTRSENAAARAYGQSIEVEGQLKSGNPKYRGVRFFGAMRVTAEGGSVFVDQEGIHVSNADEATLYFSAATNMFDKQNYLLGTRARIDAATQLPFEKLKAAATQDHQSYFRRVSLNLPQGKSAWLPTLDRLKATKDGEEDPSLAALYFNFGRYLLIGSSRPDSPLPANLQGIWAEEILTPWNGDFHLDINVQMNYWLAETCNLSDCHAPLLNFVPWLVPNGAKTAKAYYNAKGWVAHVITNPWLFTSPGEGAEWGSTCTGGAWLCDHLWEHYAFTKDAKYLASAYPVMRGAAEFFLDMLIEEPKHHWLVTAPSNSPENAFVHPKDGPVNTCMGPSIDTEIVRELFTNVILASQALGIDTEFRGRVAKAKEKLAPFQIGKFGQLQEWLEDYAETDPHHRHVSHLYGLYPGNQISPATTPKFAEAAKVALKRRGDLGTGWSLAWKVSLWARLGDGDHAWLLLKRLFNPVSAMGYDMSNGGGTYPNLFDAHPPFQIDGNFGATAGIGEMLMQSQDGVIRLLPALPKAWAKEGSAHGLRARGNATVDFEWKDGKVSNYKISGPGAKDLRVVLPS